MPIGSDTADVRMINIALIAADGSGQLWQDAAQMIPLGMNGNPEAFVAAIKSGLPLVNRIGKVRLWRIRHHHDPRHPAGRPCRRPSGT